MRAAERLRAVAQHLGTSTDDSWPAQPTTLLSPGRSATAAASASPQCSAELLSPTPRHWAALERDGWTVVDDFVGSEYLPALLAASRRVPAAANAAISASPVYLHRASPLRKESADQPQWSGASATFTQQEAWAIRGLIHPWFDEPIFRGENTANFTLNGRFFNTKSSFFRRNSPSSLHFQEKKWPSNVQYAAQAIFTTTPCTGGISDGLLVVQSSASPCKSWPS